ncbi:MAG: hypothetical protein IKO52_09935, partial [Clostridia bacterium]|nr:hypothetical protein [Clostridia bacterium]
DAPFVTTMTVHASALAVISETSAIPAIIFFNIMPYTLPFKIKMLQQISVIYIINETQKENNGGDYGSRFASTVTLPVPYNKTAAENYFHGC